VTASPHRSEPWLTVFNAESEEAAVAELLTVCSSERWARQVAAGRPFSDGQQLQKAAEHVWLALDTWDWLEALEGHPRIGDRGGSSEQHSRQEQASVAKSPIEVLEALRDANRRYEDRFGHVFLISAAGRNAEDILAELNRRLVSAPEAELREAAEQHRWITRLRLQRLLTGSTSVAGR
jgi:OHCU decarboxylase